MFIPFICIWKQIWGFEPPNKSLYPKQPTHEDEKHATLGEVISNICHSVMLFQIQDIDMEPTRPF